jgi:tetratricopeptide (TPR) repeat protein
MNSMLKYIYFFLFILLFATEASSQQATTDKFKQGVAFFTSGNYKEALQVWTDIYNTGYRSSNLEYNIGNAYFKLNDIPDAILFYERAYLLNPTDENINYNLQIARTLTVDRFQEIPELFFVRSYNFVSLCLSTNSWSRISIFSFVLFLLYYLYTFIHHDIVRKYLVSGLLFYFLFSQLHHLHLPVEIKNWFTIVTRQ